MMLRKSFFGNSRLSASFVKLIVVKAACQTGSTRKLLQTYSIPEKEKRWIELCARKQYVSFFKSINGPCSILQFCIPDGIWGPSV